MEVLSVNVASPSAPIIGTTVALLIGATVTDLRARRIPNFLTFPAAGVGVALHSMQEGWWGLALALVGAVTAPGVLMLLRAFRRLGMGDVKLAMAVGALLGPAAGALESQNLPHAHGRIYARARHGDRRENHRLALSLP